MCVTSVCSCVTSVCYICVCVTYACVCYVCVCVTGRDPTPEEVIDWMLEDNSDTGM